MTRWGVERTPRVAHRPSPVPPAGVSAHMPPPSQGAERRTERHAARIVLRVGIRSRWGLRALVIGGLAGAAWLLTGAAAHAADRAPAPEGSPPGASSVLGSVLHGDAAKPVVTRVLQAAAQPLESNHHTNEQHLVRAPLAGALIEITNGKTDADSALGGATRVFRDLTAPLRLTGGPSASRQIDPGIGSLSAPVIRVLRPAVDLSPSAAMSEPAAQHRHHRAIPLAVGSTANDVATITGSPVGDRDIAGPTVAVGQWRLGATDRHHAAVEADAPEAYRETPAGGGPAPLQGHLGAVSGIPAVGSGAPTEGSSATFLPVAVGVHAVAPHRMPLAADVEARHHHAEAPTVSPD